MNTFFLSKINKNKRRFYSLNFLLSSQNKTDNKNEEAMVMVSSSKYKDDRFKSKSYYKRISTII